MLHHRSSTRHTSKKRRLTRSTSIEHTMASALARSSLLLASRGAAASSRATVPLALRRGARALSGGHDDHHDTTIEPPFVRLPMPSGPVRVPRVVLVLRTRPPHAPPPPPSQLPEEHELIWDDGVAPEMALDIDAPHISAWEGLAWWLGGFAFFYGVYVAAKATGHPELKPTVRGGCGVGWVGEPHHHPPSLPPLCRDRASCRWTRSTRALEDGRRGSFKGKLLVL